MLLMIPICHGRCYPYLKLVDRHMMKDRACEKEERAIEHMLAYIKNNLYNPKTSHRSAYPGNSSRVYI